MKPVLLAFLALAVACQTQPSAQQDLGPDAQEDAQQDAHGHSHSHDHGHDHDHDHGKDKADCPYAEGHGMHTADHSFEDVEKWAPIFDAPDRDAWQKPEELVTALEIAPGSTVVDVGAGTGYFNAYLSLAVGPGGKVIALDAEPAMVQHVAARIEAEGLANVEARETPVDKVNLALSEADFALMVNTYHHVKDRVAYFGLLRDAVVLGGRLAVVDYLPGDTPHGPAAPVRVDPETVKTELAQAGWTFSKSLDLLPEQYVLIFEAPKKANENPNG